MGPLSRLFVRVPEPAPHQPSTLVVTELVHPTKGSALVDQRSRAEFEAAGYRVPQPSVPATSPAPTPGAPKKKG